MWRKGKRGRPPEYKFVRVYHTLKEAREKCAKLRATGTISKIQKFGREYQVYKKVKVKGTADTCKNVLP